RRPGVLSSCKAAMRYRLRTSRSNEIAELIRFAIGNALTFCGHVISQLGFADVDANRFGITQTSSVSNNSNRAVAGSVQPTIRSALESCRGVFISLGIISAVINILMLTGSFFMLQVYDRVLPSQSV